MPIEVSDTEVLESEKEWLSVELTRDADRSPVTLELCVANGHQDGPVLWLQGSVHGNEPVGGLAVRDFMIDIDPEDLYGTVIALPVANPKAFANRQRGSQIRHLGARDLNSLFPGSANGSFSEQLAHRIFSLVEEHADYVVDVHSADEQVVMHTGFAIVPDTDDRTAERGRTLGKVSGMPHVLELSSENLRGFMTTEAALGGVPSVTLESGGGSQVFDWAYENYQRSIRNVLREIDALDGSADTDETAQIHDEATSLFAQAGGFAELAVKGGEHVAPGDHLGRITDIRGNSVETFDASGHADVLAVRTMPTVRPGDLMIELAPR